MAPSYNPGQYPYPPPGPPRRGTSPVVWLLALFGVGTVLCAVGGGVWIAMNADELAKAGAVEAADGGAAVAKAALPPVERHVPKHALAILDGCTDADLDAVSNGIGSAIDVGAPLYNAGNFAGCYHMYEGTASDLARSLPAACEGPRKALESGRARAASLKGASAQAWAMRDAFDGLVDVIARHGGK